MFHNVSFRLPVLFFLLTVLVCGQTGNGSLQGSVNDASGAVMPGAHLILLNLGTAREYDTTSNEVGFYAFPSLLPGRYRLTAEANGMEKWEGEFVLQVRQAAQVNPSLKIAGATTQITVAGDVSALVSTTNATLGNVLERERIEQLPLNVRKFNTLVLQNTPGMEDYENNPRVYGLRAGNMEFTQDGVSLENRRSGMISERAPGLDTVQEFRVETNNSNARLSRPATTIASTKSGTNVLHGSMFETARHSALGTARRRQDFWTKAPLYIRNEYGVSMGGPVVLPKLYNGRNRTFFFAAYEAMSQIVRQTGNTSVPTVAMRGGDFSGLVDGTGRQYTIYDPWSTGANYQRVPFVGNKIPTTRQSPVAAYLYSISVLPTHNNVNPLVESNFYGQSR